RRPSAPSSGSGISGNDRSVFKTPPTPVRPESTRMSVLSFLSALSFRARLIAMVTTLVFTAIVVITGSVYIQYRSSYVAEALERLQTEGAMDAAAFTQWLIARQHEMQFLARLEAARQMDADALSHLLQELVAVQPAYDTVFVVDTQGRGIAGI